ncbi:MAG: hypothetical protein ACE5JX_09435 [Acidobacteriota bacterium]
MRQSKISKTSLIVLSGLAATVLVSSFFVADVQGQMMKMMKPKMVTLKGTVIDLTCSAKGKAMMNSWHNAKSDDHMTPDGPKKTCATMCLKGGQPAALFSGDSITAVFACNPQATLSNFAQDNVEVRGFWAGDGTSVKTFVPQKIRKSGSGSWQDVNCATMHG